MDDHTKELDQRLNEEKKPVQIIGRSRTDQGMKEVLDKLGPERDIDEVREDINQEAENQKISKGIELSSTVSAKDDEGIQDKSRRSFIGKGILALTTLFGFGATAKTVYDLRNKQEEQVQNQLKAVEVNPNVTEQNVNIVAAQVNSQKVNVQIENPSSQNQAETQNSSEVIQDADDLIFPGYDQYSNDDKEFITHNMQEFLDRYSQQNFNENISNILAQYRPMIETAFQEMNLGPDKEILKQIFLGIILVESQGNPNAFNKDSEATGLAQVLPTTANLTKEQLFDPMTNIKAGLRYFNQMYDTFGDPGMAVGAYHDGQGNEANFLGNYLSHDKGIKGPEIDKLVDRTDPNRAVGAVEVREKYGVDYKDLRKSPYVAKIMEGLLDDSQKYVFNVTAALSKIKQYQMHGTVS